jgi:hypothetical protein
MRETPGCCNLLNYAAIACVLTVIFLFILLQDLQLLMASLLRGKLAQLYHDNVCITPDCCKLLKYTAFAWILMSLS